MYNVHDHKHPTDLFIEISVHSRFSASYVQQACKFLHRYIRFYSLFNKLVKQVSKQRKWLSDCNSVYR